MGIGDAETICHLCHLRPGSMSEMAILQQEVFLDGQWLLDNGSFWAHRCGHVARSLFLANFSFPSRGSGFRS